MIYKVTVPPVKRKTKSGKFVLDFPILGLNELLAGRIKDYRSGKYRNPIKQTNDAICCRAIRSHLRGVHITKPIIVHYDIFAKDKRHDRLNLASSLEKSFADSLQLEKVIANDGWDDMQNAVYSFAIDKANPRAEVTIEEVDI